MRALALTLVLAGCNDIPDSWNACEIACHQPARCGGPSISDADCASSCGTYGGTKHAFAVLEPAPDCVGGEDAQRACVKEATKHCDAFLGLVSACPKCHSIDGASCTSDADCTKYVSGYQCDTSRPGGYCTRACSSSLMDCDYEAGYCSPATPPSFLSPSPGPTNICRDLCDSGSGCRAGYTCIRGPDRPVCDVQ